MNYITEIKLFHDWLETHGEMTPAAVLLWYGLMFLTNKAGWRKGVALPMSRIEGVTLMTESRIYRARKILVEAGILEVEEKGSHRASVYTLIPFEDFRDQRSDPHNDTHFGSITKPRLNRDVRKNQKKKFSLVAWLEKVESPWNELMRMWLEYKKARNEAYTSEMGTKACLTKLKNLSGNSPQTAQTIIEQSMANNWAGLFPLSAQTSRGSSLGSGTLVPATGQRIGQILQPDTEEHRNAILDKFKRKAAADMSHRPSEQKDNTKRLKLTVMGTQSIANLIKELRKDSSTVLVRESTPFSWTNDIGQAGQLLEVIFKAVDSTIDIYHSLPEYFEIKHWMLNTEGKGLLMMGNCGRGKSVIASGVIPVLFRMKGYTLRPVHAQVTNLQSLCNRCHGAKSARDK